MLSIVYKLMLAQHFPYEFPTNQHMLALIETYKFNAAYGINLYECKRVCVYV